MFAVHDYLQVVRFSIGPRGCQATLLAGKDAVDHRQDGKVKRVVGIEESL